VRWIHSSSIHRTAQLFEASEFEIVPSLPPVIVLDDFPEDDDETWEDIRGVEEPDKLTLTFSYAQMVAMSK
jgi:hypothetical protein